MVKSCKHLFLIWAEIFSSIYFIVQLLKKQSNTNTEISKYFRSYAKEHVGLFKFQILFV